MVFTVSFASGIPPSISKSDFKFRSRYRVRVRSELPGSSEVVSLDRAETVFIDRKGAVVKDSDAGRAVSEVSAPEGLKLLYEDGYRTSVIDYLDVSREIIKPDGGPPRWFCPVECGLPIKGSPLLLFLPGIDGVGLGLILHHKCLGKVFEVRCMHIPVYDRTPFEGLVEFVENTVRFEHAASPNKPIYLVGDSFGGCLALAIAARNPSIDLVLILSNPATSFGRSQLQPWLPVLEWLPNELHVTVPYLLSFVMGDPVKMGMASVESGLSPSETLDQLSKRLSSMLPRLSGLAEIIPKETLLWKLKLLKSAALYTNSRLHAVKAEVLVLASGKDNLLPSKDEAERLWNTLPNCKVRYFKDNGHTLLLEDGLRLLTVLKGTNMYRRSRRYDYVSDYLPPSITEFRETFDHEFLNLATSPVVLSTLKNGEIVRGLSGVPDEGPVLLVGYHMLMGIELGPIVEAFLREKNVMIRGIAHPMIFSKKVESSLQEVSRMDVIRIFGALPVSAINFYRLFSSKSFVLLYPGGAREALHRKGEEYKLFWPDQPEFVRMAARFGATIVPFGAVGEDDVAELVFDYNDQMSIPFMRDWIADINKGVTRLRTDMTGEVANQDLFLPGLLPKIPGRFYYLFGKPIETRGRVEALKDREKANEVYMQIKSEVEGIISYLKRKREEDPYRGILQRTIYQATWGSTDQVPTFDP
ncbi:phytyl ester synthase 1, chloroplastic [Magnolia sinica]|uniref:phytyl ester synthase 1, chloroplastic n=1 Tax=Magnolia sinica TaxID=86752 RepID=UPI00265A9512|nr:phytyl ester synthase 1, chloroplastic [Magnolia sinica]XP_058076257.1 phytyl ester synthase 1, chloroplastic [Magnolia sinica]XP_058076258.1 phytyl ester synthase 1, chloroplastic [Magnolia sinica]